MEINEFSNEVIEQLNYYVYRLVDPRNGQTFYVGKGKGNRVFEHVKGSIGYYEGVSKNEIDDNNDPNKLETIRQILNSGLKVIHIIQRWGLTEKEAFEVEAALIDSYSGLKNIQSGHYSERGVCNSTELQERLSAKEYEEPKDYKYLIIKVKDWRLQEMAREHGVDKSRYESTRGCWHIRTPSINEFPYALSVTGGIVREVYKILKWHNCDNSPRKYFDGIVADETVRNKFINKKIPSIYAKKGMASPVLRSKNM